MMRMRIAFASSPAQVDEIFHALGEDLRDFTPAMIRIRLVLAEMFRKIFATQGGETGNRWLPDSPAAVRRKMRGGTPEATLRLTGALEEALTAAEGGRGAIRTISKSTDGIPKMSYGTRLGYAAALHYGIASRPLPARPLVVLSDAARAEAEGELRAHLEARLAAAAAKLGGA